MTSDQPARPPHAARLRSGGRRSCRWGASLAAVVISAIVLCGCQSASRHAPAPAPAPSPTRPPATLPASLRSVAADIDAGIYPQCADTAGLPVAIVVHGHNVTTGAPEVRCRTGAGDSDATSVVRTNCGAGPAKARGTVFYWASTDVRTADQHVYVGRVNGVVRTVTGLSARELPPKGRALALIRRSAGC